jgi:uncharacterized membrane protein
MKLITSVFIAVCCCLCFTPCTLAFHPPGSRIMKSIRPSSTPRVMMTSVEQGIGVEGCKMVSISTVNALPIPLQAAVFVGSFAAMGFGAFLILGFFHILESIIPDFYSSFKASFGLLGPIFMAAGAAHFAVKSDFENIYPYRGAWGFWLLPGTAEFHVIWTGVAELALGAGLSVGSLLNVLGMPSSGDFLVQYSSLGLLYLTILVTPANIFMFTHGARLPMSQPPVPVQFHYVRGAFQSVLFAQFYALAQPLL